MVGAGGRREIEDDGFNDTEALLVDRHTVYCAIEMWRDRDVALLVGPARTKGQEVKVVRGGFEPPTHGFSGRCSTT